VKPLGHLVPLAQEPAQQNLRHDDRGGQLHRLELVAGDGRGQEPQRDPQDGGDEGDQQDGEDASRQAHVQRPVAEERGERRLHEGEDAVGQGVAQDDVGPVYRGGHEAFQRSRSAFAHSCHRSQEEHDKQREDGKDGQFDMGDQRLGSGEDLVEERDEHDGDQGDEGDGARIVPELA